MSDVNPSPPRFGENAAPEVAEAWPAGDAGQAPVTVNRVLDQAHKLYVAGQLGKAERLCAQIVSQRPRMAAAHNLLAAIQHAQGNSAAAVKSMHRAISLDGENAQFFSNLGEMERQRGKLPQALLALRQAVRLDPSSTEALNNLGIVHYDRGEFGEAAKHYEQAIAINPSYAEAHNNLGNALRALGRFDEALDHYQRALLIRENYPGAYNNMASILLDRDQIAEAEFAYRKAIALSPRYFEAYGNLATLLVEHGRSDEALRVLGDALKIEPKHAPTLIHVARTQLSTGNYAQAEQACRLALEEEPDSAEAFAVLGEVLHETDRFDEALTAFDTALTLKPMAAEARTYYGICLKSVGRLDEAREQLVKSLELNPRAYGIYANLADLQKFTPDHPHLKAMEAIMAEATDPMSERYMALHFGIGKAYEDIGEYAKAFEHFQTGATLKRAKLKYDEAETFGFFDSIRGIFSAEFFAKPPFEGVPSELPVFIIGMPRSGSTLVEQILSSHPQTFRRRRNQGVQPAPQRAAEPLPRAADVPADRRQDEPGPLQNCRRGLFGDVEGHGAVCDPRDRQAAHELLLRRPASRDVSEGQVHPHQAQSGRHLLVRLHQAVQGRHAAQLRLRRAWALLQEVRGIDGALGQGAAARHDQDHRVRGRGRQSRRLRARTAGISRAALGPRLPVFP